MKCGTFSGKSWHDDREWERKTCPIDKNKFFVWLTVDRFSALFALGRKSFWEFYSVHELDFLCMCWPVYCLRSMCIRVMVRNVRSETFNTIHLIQLTANEFDFRATISKRIISYVRCSIFLLLLLVCCFKFFFSAQCIYNCMHSTEPEVMLTIFK